MACQEHPNYSGQRTPRSDCKSCWETYNEKKSSKDKKVDVPPPKEKKAKPKEPAEPKEAIVVEQRPPKPGVFKVEGRMPDRLLCVTTNQYRSEVISMLNQLLPQYIAYCNYDAGTIFLEERGKAIASNNIWAVTGGTPVIQAEKKVAALAASTKCVLEIKPGDVYFSDVLHTALIFVTYNDKTKMVWFREWHTRELLSLPLKEFEKLDLRDVITDDDFNVNPKLEVKVLHYT